MPKLYGKITIKRLVGVVKIVPGVSGSGGKLQEKNVTPTIDGFSVMPDGGYAGLSRVNVAAPALQVKSVEPGTAANTVQADAGYLALGSVTVKAAPLQAKSAKPSMEVQNITPDAGVYGLSSVEVEPVPVSVDENGYTDIYGLRQLHGLDFAKTDATMTLVTTLEGGVEITSEMELDEDGNIKTITTGGVAASVTWEGFE